MAAGEGYTIAHRDECETSGHWRLVRRTLGLNSFGMNLVDIPPGEQIPEHDETARDQEEVFLVVAGSATLVIDGEDAQHRRGPSRGSSPSDVARSATTGRRAPPS
jgi:uncharacterized cupin superfamily protein